LIIELNEFNEKIGRILNSLEDHSKQIENEKLKVSKLPRLLQISSLGDRLKNTTRYRTREERAIRSLNQSAN